MIKAMHRRHDISDKTWELIEPHLPGRKVSWGGQAKDNRQFINAVFWILRTGAPWRDLPPDYGDWKNTHRRFCRWRDAGLELSPFFEAGLSFTVGLRPASDPTHLKHRLLL